jgi:hypothetical protein
MDFRRIVVLSMLKPPESAGGGAPSGRPLLSVGGFRY